MLKAFKDRILVMTFNFAHDGEAHETVIDSTSHFLGLGSTELSLLVLMFAIIIPSMVHFITRRLTATFIATMIELLLIGVLSYSFAPVLSVIAIVLGFAASLAVVLVGAKN